MLTGKSNVWGNNETVRLFILTLTIAGLQFTWGVEMSYVNVYLLSLGMTKSHISLVWAMGPLAGLLTQPVVGLLSDASGSKWGRRRPFMVIGSFFVALSLVTMAWAEELSFVLVFVHKQYRTRVMAVLSVFLTDFSINTVQACCRALIVDVLPTSLQQQGNGWAARQTAVGHLIGYFLGFLDLVSMFGGLIGDTQLKCLCIISSLALLVTVGITSALTTEQTLVTQNRHHVTWKSLLSSTKAIFTSLYHTSTTLPPRIRLIIAVQFFAWYGWFSFLYYSSTWVGEVYQKQHGDGQDDGDTVGRVGRIGSMSLTVFSIVSLLASFVMPYLASKSVFGFKPRLTKIWTGAHVIFSLAMFATLYVSTVAVATAVIGLCGYAWAITTWAPFALMGEEIHKVSRDTENNVSRDAEGNTGTGSLSGPRQDLEAGVVGAGSRDGQYESRDTQARDAEYMSRENNGTRDLEGGIENTGPGATGFSGQSREGGSRENLIRDFSERDFSPRDYESRESSPSEPAQTGVYLGIHNIAISAPQFVCTFVSSFVFFLLEGDGDGGRAIAMTFQIGGCMTLVAAYLSTKL